MPAELAVLLNHERVATLTEVGMALGCSLTYTDEAVDRYGEGAIIVSVGLPVRAETYPAVDTKYFLEGLLPEAHVRAALANKARVAESDTFGLLREYGLDCAGAIQLQPLDLATPVRRPHVVWLDPDELDDAVRELPAAPLGIAIEQGVRSSLGGLQGKLPLVVEGGRVGAPADGRPSTHILKPARLLDGGQQEWDGIVAAETFGLRVVGACLELGLAVRAAHGEPWPLASRPALMVTRFDRIHDSVSGDGAFEAGVGTRRVHQEDAAQALGTLEKYQRFDHTPPRLVDIADMLDRSATVPATERRALMELVVLNAVLGNCDAHARNISLVLQGGRVELAPAYDVVPTCVWPRHDRELSLRIGGESVRDDLRREHFLDEADRWGLRPRAASQLIDRAVGAAAEAMVIVEADLRERGWWEPVLDEAVAQARARVALFGR